MRTGIVAAAERLLGMLKWAGISIDEGFGVGGQESPYVQVCVDGGGNGLNFDAVMVDADGTSLREQKFIGSIWDVWWTVGTRIAAFVSRGG